MVEVMDKLQHMVTLVEEDDFLFIIKEDLKASAEKNRNSCFSKILVDKELHVQNIKCCPRMAWHGNDFRVCKIGLGLY